MNKNTQAALLEFIKHVEILAQGVVHMTGGEDCAKLLDSAEALRDILEKDETIV